MSAPQNLSPWPRSVPGTRFTEVRHEAEVDSTNRVVIDEAGAGAAEGLVVVADHQTAGRGRLDRRWQAPAGANLLVSVLLRPDLPLRSLYRCVTAVVLAAAAACASEAGATVTCKWPNDLVVGDRKLGGILAETVPNPSAGTATPPGPSARPAALVVGMGLNVAWPGPDDDLPADLRGRATSILAETGRVTDRASLLRAILEDLHARLLDLASPGGAERLAEAYRQSCSTLGREVAVETAGGTLRGRAEAVDADGALVVVTGDGARHTVVVGDVVHLRTSGGAAAGPPS